MTRPAHDPALDGLRAVSIALVLAAHAGLGRIVPGGLGVTIFFTLSGFLITTLLMEEHAAHGRIALGRFYLRRALRLAPAATAYVVVAGLAFTALGGGPVPLLADAAALFDLANLAEIFTRLFDAKPGAVPHPFVILWSLAVEEHAYLLWPPVLALVLARAPRAPLVLASLLLLLAAASLAWRCHLTPLCALPPHADAAIRLCGVHPDQRLYKSTDTRLDSIGFGALAAVLRRGRHADRFRALTGHPAAIGLAVAALAPTLLVRDPWIRETVRPSVQGLALLVLLAALAGRDGLTRRVLSRPLPVAVGRLSYGLYLWHWLALMIATRVAGLDRSRFVLVFAALSAGFALLSWHAIETPFLRLRHRFGSTAPAGLARRPDTAPLTHPAAADAPVAV